MALWCVSCREKKLYLESEIQFKDSEFPQCQDCINKKIEFAICNKFGKQTETPIKIPPRKTPNYCSMCGVLWDRSYQFCTDCQSESTQIEKYDRYTGKELSSMEIVSSINMPQHSLKYENPFPVLATIGGQKYCMTCKIGITKTYNEMDTIEPQCFECWTSCLVDRIYHPVNGRLLEFPYISKTKPSGYYTELRLHPDPYAKEPIPKMRFCMFCGHKKRNLSILECCNDHKTETKRNYNPITGLLLGQFSYEFIPEKRNYFCITYSITERTHIRDEKYEQFGQIKRDLSKLVVYSSGVIQSRSNILDYGENNCPERHITDYDTISSQNVVTRVIEYDSRDTGSRFGSRNTGSISRSRNTESFSCPIDTETLSLGTETLSPVIDYDEVEFPITKRIYVFFTIIIDCTGSMGSCINDAKQKIRTIIKEYKDMIEKTEKEKYGKNTKVIMKVSIVGYRDFSDSEHLAYIPYTSDISKIEGILEKLVANGGYDIPEDLLGAMLLITNTDEKAGPILQRVIDNKDDDIRLSQHYFFIISDAPGHGRFMNDLSDNNLLKGYSGTGTPEIWRDIINVIKWFSGELIIINVGSGLQYNGKMIDFFKGLYDDERLGFSLKTPYCENGTQVGTQISKIAEVAHKSYTSRR